MHSRHPGLLTFKRKRMTNDKPTPRSANGSSHGWLLQQQLAENEHRMQLLNQEQAIKIAELTRVQQELEELNKLHPSYKRKK